MDTLKVLAGLIGLVAVGAYAISVQQKYDELGKHYLIVHEERKELYEENTKLKQMYADLRKEVVKKGDQP